MRRKILSKVSEFDEPRVAFFGPVGDRVVVVAAAEAGHENERE